MSVKLNLQPFSAVASQTKDISFVLSGLNSSKKYRIAFENATFNRDVKVVSCKNGTNSANKLFVSKSDSISGEIDLSLNESDAVSVVSIYANIEEYTESEDWRLSDIAAFSFQIENSSKKTTGDKVSVYPPFVGIEQKAAIKVQTDPNSNLHVIVNNKRFIVKSNFNGEGSFSFRAIDVLGESSLSSSSVQKFQIKYAKSTDNYVEVYDSGTFVHFVPENMKALQSNNDSAPECAILDPEPGQGLTLSKLDDYCIDGPVIGPFSIFDTEDTDFYNSKVGFCSEPRQIYPTESDDAVCRIFNSTSSSLLTNGAGLAVFSSQETFASDPYSIPTLSSRVFVAHIPSSLKYNGNPIRDGTIVKPPEFYHTITPSDISIDEKYGITFRVSDGSLFEIQYTTIQGTVSEVIASFVELINNDLTARLYGIKAIDHSSYMEVKSDIRFTIKTNIIIGDGVLETKLNSNKTLDLLTDEKGVNDLGNTVIFFVPKVGYQSHSIVSRDLTNKIIRINVPSGFNNDIGPSITDNIYCEKFIVIDSSTPLSTTDVLEVNPLPHIYDIFNREVSCVYPVIAIRKENPDGGDLAYVVCQAPVNGIYQLFFYSFRVGISPENGQWKQLTHVGENKNAKIACDKAGNLHLIWESDRMGVTQVYYSVLGSSSKLIVNSTIMSVIDKNINQNTGLSLISVGSPSVTIQDGWTRIINEGGKVSVFDKSYVSVEGDPSIDSAMVYYSLNKDEFGNGIPWYFNQLSYQLSFEFWMPLLADGVLSSSDIDAKFSEWKSEFEPVGDYKYKKDDNIYTIDSYASFYENMIPICGSYKLNTDDLRIISGGAVVADVPHRSSLVYADYSRSIKLSEPSTIKHFMLAMMPEKIRFKAKNIESYVQYCERLGLSSVDCSGFNNEIEYEIGTGRYKLALLVSTSENDNSGELSKKNYKISRFLSGFVDFRSSKMIDIAVHYSKMSSDYIEGASVRDNKSYENENRFSGDIIVSVDRKPVFATSFFADFSDQYRQFDIGLGIPPGQGFVIDDSIPYKGNTYEQGSMKQIFAQIKIGPHSSSLNPKYFNVSNFDRNTSQMIVPERINSIIANGDFENTVLPYSDSTIMYDGYTAVTGWTVANKSIYRSKFDFVAASTPGFRSSSGKSWFELSGLSSGSTVLKGSIFQTFNTTIGRNYYVFLNISNHPDSYSQGSSITKKVKISVGSTTKTFSTRMNSTAQSAMNWKTVYMTFTATSSLSTLTLENSSDQFGNISDAEYGPQVDSVIVVDEEDLNNELRSSTTAENLMIDDSEYNLNYSLNASEEFSQLPVTMSFSSQNKTPSIFIDKVDKVHAVWQSNRDGFWDIYYSGFRSRGTPFIFDTKITSTESSSVNPSIAVDSKGKRLITWQDNRDGFYQIYAAISKSIDSSIADSCKQDEVDEFLYQWNSSIDPYYDPYVLPISQLNCAIKFSFTAPSAGLYHFNLLFYEDKEYTNPYKNINSSKSISGWSVGGSQFSHSGLNAEYNNTYDITYIPSYEDNLSGRVLYVVVEFKINAIAVDFINSTNVKMLQPYAGLNLGISRVQDSNYRAILESEGLSNVKVDAQSLTSFNGSVFSGMRFVSPLAELPGFNIGDSIKSVLLHFDPVGVSGSITSVIKFTSPIVAAFVSTNSVIAGNEYFGYPGVIYPEVTGIGSEEFDLITISADRKTMTVSSVVNPALDEIRVILLDESSVIGQSEFVYYCPDVQGSRCDVRCEFINNFTVDENVHFRITFYSNPEKTDVVMSSFTRDDNLNWISGEETFPTEGILVSPSQKINVIYVPEIVPFELYESQNPTTFSDRIIRQPLLCGITYQVVIETYRNGVFYVESESSFICPCKKTNSDLWNLENDSQTWTCSGQGFEDFRISITDEECLTPIISVNEFDFFYITWQDFRYSNMSNNQIPLSPDCFMGIYDSTLDKLICSGQGGYDRRLTNFSSNNLILYNYSLFIDPFQNINMVMHDGKKVYWQSCSLGCSFASISKDLILPCMFTDETDSSLFVLGGTPDRNVSQYQKIRVSEPYIAFSTYVDLTKPIVVVNECFITFDIIGVPGTYAYRLRNENDSDWSEWLPIGADLPIQTQTDEDTTSGERDYFRAYFTQRDVFTAPWVISQGNGQKRVCCEILTFFGKTETFCVDFMATYNNLEYKIDLYFDSEFTNPVPKFKNYMVVSEYKTETNIDDTNLTSIKEDAVKIPMIYAKVEFNDKKKIQSLEKIQSIGLFNYSNQITMSVYQQGINDQLSLPLVKISEGIYRGSFSVNSDDGVVNVDGLAIIVIDVPGQCKPVSFTELSQRADTLESSRTLDQNVTIFDNFTVFRDKYSGDDIRGSFGNPNYYKIKKF